MNDTKKNPGSSLEESFQIAPLAAADSLGMVSMIRDNLEAFEEAGSVLAAADRRLNNFEGVYSAPGSVYLVAKLGDKIIGGAGLGPFAGLSPSEGIAEIRELVIDPPHRGQGYGAKLLESCLDWAQRFSYHRLYLETTPQMNQAQKLFERFHFRPITQRNPTATGSSEHKEEGPIPCYYMLEK